MLRFGVELSNTLPLLLPPQAQLKPRDSSVEVRSDWEVKEEMDFPRLMKMRYMEVDDPSDISDPSAFTGEFLLQEPGIRVRLQHLPLARIQSRFNTSSTVQQNRY
ncbi:UNVERIFIED_CONTAM: hypothetical protein FKN15_058456 [Acipenser sinensis]